MDLLCTESIVTHSELSLYSESISCSSACFSTIKKCSTSGSAIVKRDPAESVNVPIACNMSNLMYVLSSVATPISATKSTKQPQQRKSTSCQILSKLCPHRQCNINTSWMCTAVKKGTDEADDKHFAYENAHMIVTDPIFKTDRCLKNALKSEENHEQILGTHFNTVQKDITPAMRKIVAQWMMEVCVEEKCQEEVVLLAINYMDRFLSTKSVRKTHLQTLAAACLLLASKLREPSCRALSAELLVFYTDNSICKGDLIKWELYVLSRLGWDLSSMTPLDFLELLIIQLPVRCKIFSGLNIEKVRSHAQTLISLAAQEYRFSKYAASTIAASSIATSINAVKWHIFTDDNIHFLFSFFTDLTSIKQDQLQQCILYMNAICKEHSHKLQPFILDDEKPEPISGYYKSPYYEPDYCHQKHIMSIYQNSKLQTQPQ
ncbi:G1/S-specific cyclin-D1 [Drosophila hydei]|uniref:G1/S-specific cyclin-D1 n=1 Tax=Drosophila hydei TaxID=7224 RepID=A0A6J2STR1_DROHY|nr:G1/S-specific cyclin-D1 [Drosophila hydei]XP_030079614.1 G1/S-specific cyclin-D1 [Drosophila hydei]XP_030079615.1 G1/S-specific cyclin-D1 [Drosophila hydei]XP_030079616.1 G1/S-specific cyclin-D1 [Drosophila hydei]XP_030079617.1 G1/S-specific cyclin-D1 [Drosophila hydei]